MIIINLKGNVRAVKNAVVQRMIALVLIAQKKPVQKDATSHMRLIFVIISTKVKMLSLIPAWGFQHLIYVLQSHLSRHM